MLPPVLTPSPDSSDASTPTGLSSTASIPGLTPSSGNTNHHHHNHPLHVHGPPPPLPAHNSRSSTTPQSSNPTSGPPPRPGLSLPSAFLPLQLTGTGPDATPGTSRNNHGLTAPPSELPIKPPGREQPLEVERTQFKFYPHQGRLNIPGVCQDLMFVAEDLLDQGEIGRGAYGFVNRMRHKPTNTLMAVKRIRSTLDEKQVKNTLNDLDIVVKSADCCYIVKFYGALFKEGDCWICMEMMAASLDKFYRFVYRHLFTSIPEKILGKIAVAVVLALDYLKQKLNTIHRDVKPSNILIDRAGNIKLCDFGISGHLVDSIAQSQDAGCKPYMAPERIHPKQATRGYDIRSDVWSLGITMMELATGQFPYPTWNSVFDQLTSVLRGDAPRLPDNDTRFSENFRLFVHDCLNKEVEKRPKYSTLKEHPFFVQSQVDDVNVGEYFTEVLNEVPNGQELCDFMAKDSC